MNPTRAALLLGAAALTAAYFVYPPVRLFAWAMAGRSPQCPAWQAVKCEQHRKDLEREKDRMLAGMRRIQRDSMGYDQYATPAGTYWIPAGARESYMLPFNLAEQALMIYGKGAQQVRRDDVVLDCGANVGVFTRVALSAGARRVYAIEPAPENLECLRRNFSGEIDSGRVIVVPKGVWDKEDFLTLHIDPKNSAADSFVIERKGSVGIAKVPLTTIDRMVDLMGITQVDYIKMDIEGAEPQALAGAVQTIKKYKPRMSISAYHEPDHPVLIPKIILGARPDYLMLCGPCAEADGRIRPDVLWFR